MGSVWEEETRESMSAEVSGGVSAGNYARNETMQIVAADDWTRVGKHKTCVYTCACGCGYTVHLKRGTANRPHFAYAADHVATCKGSSGCGESTEHYDAKWLLHEKFGELCFWETCSGGHRTTSSRYSREIWVATVEKLIPGTTFRADVLLENNSTGASVALEVVHYSQVTIQKRRACDTLGTQLFEVSVKGLTKALSSRQFEIENTIPSAHGSYECELCDILNQEIQRDNDEREAHRIYTEKCKKQAQQERIEKEEARHLATEKANQEAAIENSLNERRRGEFYAQIALEDQRRRDEADQLQRHEDNVSLEMVQLDLKRRKIERSNEIVERNLAVCHSKYA